MALKPQLFHEIVDILLPFMSTEAARRVRLEIAFIESPQISASIDCSGSPLEATRRIVSALDKQYTRINDDSRSLSHLLNSVFGEVGVDHQKRIHRIQSELLSEDIAAKTESVSAAHVFISYSRRDEDFVNQLIGDLQQAGIGVWIDHVRLTPGTANWEQSIRDAIRESYALVLAATPDSRQSDYVQAELALAKMYGKPVFPVWVRGKHWIDCVPMELVKTQYVDARDSSKTQYLELITKSVKSVSKSVKQAHHEALVIEPDNTLEKTITAQQLIYTRVEPQYSPRKQSGYQTVLLGGDIPANVVRTVEQCVSCFHGDLSLTRYQFFFADTYAALVHLTEIDPHLSIVDRTGRKGAYLAHALIIADDQFEIAENNPFAIFDIFKFARTVEDLQALLLQHQPNALALPPIQITLGTEHHSNSENWTENERIHLAEIASRAREFADAHQVVRFVGNSQEVFETLRLALDIVAPNRRRHLTFDSCIDGCRPPTSVHFWALGTHIQKAVLSPYVVNAVDRKVILPDELDLTYSLSLNDENSARSKSTESISSVTDVSNAPLEALVRRGSLRSIFSKVFPPKSTSLICPSCQMQVKLYKDLVCPSCAFVFPVQYLDRLAKGIPSFLRVIGWPQTGKTVYLNALTYMLSNLSTVWRGYWFVAADQPTQQFIMRASHAFATSEFQPESTKLDERDLYIMYLENMERWGNRIFVAQDYAGENFNEMNFPEAVVPYVTKTQTILMFISLPDLKLEYGLSAVMLLNNYINTLRRNDVSLKASRRNIVVVLTKADLIHDLPQSIVQYLTSDPFTATVAKTRDIAPMQMQDMDAYVVRMQYVSEQIAKWLVQVDPQYANLINFARSFGIQLKFSVVSSLGMDFSTNSNVRHFLPLRVLDPYFWALEFE